MIRSVVLALSIVCLVLVLATACCAEGGSVTGRVFGSDTGRDLAGANVWLAGTSMGAITGLDGRFRVTGVPAGTYDIRISYVGYTTETVTGIDVADGEPAEVNVSLQVAAIGVKEVVVTAQRSKSSSASLLAERKKATSISDAIGSEQISKSPDATSGDALKRVTGLSVVDNKFVFIRGVTDRYNEATLNGVAVAGTDTDVDKKSFSFDLIPAELIENTVVIKTASPDRPGTLGGGLVEVNTLDFPLKRMVKLSVASGYRPETSTRSFLGSRAGDGDWLGRDDGSRDLPDGLTNGELIGALPNNWTPELRRAPFNGSFNLSAGDFYRFRGHDFGFIGAASYRNSYEHSDFVRQSNLPYIDFTGSSNKYSVLWGALVGLHYKPGAMHKLSVETTFDQSASDEVTLSEGVPESSALTKKQTIEWDQRSLLVSRLRGEHGLPGLLNSKISWSIARNVSEAQEPDRKDVDYQQGADRTFTMIENYRTWSELHEDSWLFSTHLQVPIGRSVFKVGGETYSRDRDFTIRAFAADHSKLSPANYYLTTLPLETIFSPENFGTGKLQFQEVTDYTGEYRGEHSLQAYFAMLDWPFAVKGRQFHAVGGVRFEDSDQRVTGETADPTMPFSRARIDKRDLLPSLNLTYRINELTNLRLAYGRSLNRPEFREMADVKYYDFDEFQNVRGNPNLTRATMNSYDVRLEVFPNIGEVIAVSYFYKDITDAVEIRLIPEPTRWVRTWFNSPNGKNQGVEVELRKSLGLVNDYLKNLTVIGNYTRVSSAIEYLDKKTAQDGSHIIRVMNRPMQGQAPWVANVGLMFAEPRLNASLTLLYNRVGRRISAVGDSRYEDIYEEPRHGLDLSVTQDFRSLRAKFSAKDMVADDRVYTMGPRAFHGSHSRFEAAPTYSLSVSIAL